MGSEIPVATKEFIARHIISVEQLEILLLLEESGGAPWTVRDINVRLRSQESSVEKWLAMFVALGLAAQSDDGYRFAPATPDLEQGTRDLAAIYRERKVRVIELIFSKPNENLLSFVRAFDLRKRP